MILSQKLDPRLRLLCKVLQQRPHWSGMRVNLHSFILGHNLHPFLGLLRHDILLDRKKPKEKNCDMR